MRRKPLAHRWLSSCLWLSSSPRCRCVMSNCRWQKYFDMQASSVSVDGDGDAGRTPPQAPRHKASRLLCHGRVKRPSTSLFSMCALALLLLHHGALFPPRSFKNTRVLSRIPDYYRYPDPTTQLADDTHLSCLRFALSGAYIFQRVFPLRRLRTDPHARIA